MSSGCQKTGCTRPASKVLTVNVPAKGWPVSLHQPVRLVIDLRLCRHCAAEAKIVEFLSDDLKQAIEITCRASKKADPDFARAFLSPISIDGEEYQQFVALRVGRSS